MYRMWRCGIAALHTGYIAWGFWIVPESLRDISHAGYS